MNWKHLWRSVAFLVAGLTAASGEAAVSLRAELSVAKASFSADEDVPLQLTLTNTGRTEVLLPYWLTLERGLKGHLFQVTCDGQRVQYTGPEYKWAKPTRQDLVRIPAGGSLTNTVDPTAYYKMGVTCDYTVTFAIPQAPTWRRNSLGALAAEPNAQVSSNAARFFIDGITAEEQAALDQIVEGLQEQAAREIIPQALGPVFRNCTSARQSQLRTALQNAQNYADEASAYLNSHASSNARHTRWFGQFTSTRYNRVKADFQKISSAIHNQTFTFDCGCNESAYAFVNPNRPYIVNLCRAFWPAPQTGEDSKGGTIIHEASHFTILGDTDDVVYGSSGCRNLAISNPNGAVRNADSHEYFCELR